MKREHEHDTIVDKFWDWWDYVDMSELLVSGLAVLLILFLIVGVSALIIVAVSTLRNADDLPPAEPSEGVAWVMPETGEVPVWLASVCADDVPSLAEYTEGDGPAPEWYQPWEPMAAEWEDANARQSEFNPIQRTDAGCPDWNVDSTIYGWDGHTMEAWEMDLFSRIVFLEFGISSQECREAGIDAILRLWESEYYSSTLFGTVSAVTENGKPAFSTYPGVWEEEYDYEKLAQIRDDCEERFVNGPVWIAPFFRLDYYHDWAQPCYEIDGVYFSTGKGWN